MKKIAILLVASLALTGCATKFGTNLSNDISAIQKFSITQSQLDSARNSYDGFVLAPLSKYSNLVRCKTGQTLTLNNPCHDRKLLKQIRDVDKQIEIAFDKTQSNITSGDNKGAVAAYSSLTSLIDIAKALINQTGVTTLGL